MVTSEMNGVTILMSSMNMTSVSATCYTDTSS